MSRFLTTIPNNLGFYNLGTVEAYPTGGAGPTAFGPNSYYGSDPLPAQSGDHIYDPIDLGDFSSIFRSVPIKNTHGGLSRKQTTFYKIVLRQPRSVQFTQNYSQFATERQTNRNTLVAFYKLFEGNRREELPINDLGYVAREAAIDYEVDDTGRKLNDYPTLLLDPGDYLFLITNDIRYLETEYDITVNVNKVDFEFINQVTVENIDFGQIVNTIADEINFGEIVS